eukprot:4146364-Pyramimonas_sp.AAC.1
MGYGIRWASRSLRGHAPNGKAVVHRVDARCKSHRLQVRFSYSAETLASAHNLEDSCPTKVTFHEHIAGPLTANRSKSILERGGLSSKAALSIGTGS